MSNMTRADAIALGEEAYNADPDRDAQACRLRAFGKVWDEAMKARVVLPEVPAVGIALDIEDIELELAGKHPEWSRARLGAEAYRRWAQARLDKEAGDER